MNDLVKTMAREGTGPQMKCLTKEIAFNLRLSIDPTLPITLPEMRLALIVASPHGILKNNLLITGKTLLFDEGVPFFPEL